jgi:serine/threonine-protein kinase HipA
MSKLFVWVRLPDGNISLAGELAATDPLATSGRFESEFEYTRQWSEATTSFALDPESMPLKTASRRFSADLFNPPLSVFDDALPDDWGRSLLAAALKIEGRKSSPTEMLLRMRGGGTGALLFTETSAIPQPLATVQSKSLPALLAAAEKFETGRLPPEDEFRKLLEGGSRAGGARPKALVHNSEGEWLVKFPSAKRDGSHDVIGLEATCLELARRAGLEVPESHLQEIGSRRTLMVRRFDVTPQNGRLHMLSLRTLCLERPGIYVQAYSDLARAVRKHSAAPQVDVAALFRQMVFNAAIGNVDDHLKNFWILAKPGGYRLAPAFDLVPDITGRVEHTLSFRSSFACPSHPDFMSIATEWKVEQAREIICDVSKAVRTFSVTAKTLAVQGGKSLEEISADIRMRLETIGNKRS